MKILKMPFKPSENYTNFITTINDWRCGRTFDNKESAFIIHDLQDSSLYWRKTNFDGVNEIIYNNDIDCYDLFTKNYRGCTKDWSPIFAPVGSIALSLSMTYEEASQYDIFKVNRFCQDTICDIVTQYTGNKFLCERWNNDLVIKGKKFYGDEDGGDRETFLSIAAIITCDCNPYKDIFSTLPGHGEREITGITNEIPALTQGVMIDEIYQRAQAFFNLENK